MNLEELKNRLEHAKDESGVIPLNFWWALLQVALELQVCGRVTAVCELNNALKGYHIPAALHKMLYDHYYHPACAEDLKIRAQFESQGTRLGEEVQKMHEELYRIAGLECPYTVWEIVHNISNRDRIRFATRKSFEKFLRVFNSTQPKENIFQKLYYGLRTDDRPDLSRLAYWFCFLSDNRIPDCDRKAAADLFNSKQAEFVRTAVLNNCYPQAVYDQCKQIVNERVDYKERLAKKWHNMICFIAQIRRGMLYYYATLDEGNKPGSAVWADSKTARHRFARGICFLHPEDAMRWAEEML